MNSSLRTIEVEGIGPLSYTITEDGTRIWHFEEQHLDTETFEDRIFDGRHIQTVGIREVTLPKPAVTAAIMEACHG